MITAETLQSWEKFEDSLKIIEDFKRSITDPQGPIDDAKREQFIMIVQRHSRLINAALRLTQNCAHLYERQYACSKLHHESKLEWWAETEKRKNQNRAYAAQLKIQMRAHRKSYDIAAQTVTRNFQMEERLLQNQQLCNHLYSYLMSLRK